MNEAGAGDDDPALVEPIDAMPEPRSSSSKGLREMAARLISRMTTNPLISGCQRSPKYGASGVQSGVEHLAYKHMKSRRPTQDLDDAVRFGLSPLIRSREDP